MGPFHATEGVAVTAEPTSLEALERRYARRAAVWLSMDSATLGGIPGAGSAKSRRRSQEQQDWRGTFAFRAEHDHAIVKLFDARRPIVYEGLVDGEVRKLEVRLTSFALQAGLAFFEGSGEPL